MLTRWNDLYDWPFGSVNRRLSTFEQLRRQMDRAFARFEGELGGFADALPHMTLDDAGENFVLRAELPGFSEQDVEITTNANSLTVRGKRTASAPEGYAVHRRERGSLEFARSFQLPSRIEPDRAEAVMRNGVLTLTLPKAAEARPKQISVTVN